MMLDPSYVLDAERSLAGCLLVEPVKTLRAVRGAVSSGDFLNANAAAVFAAASALLAADKPIDPVLIQEEAARQGMLLSNEFCGEVMRLYVTTANAAETARIIHEAAQDRAGREIGLSLADDSLTVTEALGRLQALLREQGSRLHTPMEAANAVMDTISAAASGKTRPFLATGFPSLDRQLAGGLVAGGLITLAARPGTGKTTAALAIAENVAAAGGKVLYISLEQTEAQLWACRAANVSGLSRTAIYGGKLRDEDWPRLNAAFDLLAKRPFFIRDVPSTLEDIEREARCLDDLALVVVDHIGLIKPTAKGSRGRYELMTDTAHRLKQLALSLRVPILGLCQLNRQSEQRDSKRPTMADLRDSGAVEEDSDVVCLLCRPAQYLPEDERPKPWESQPIDFITDKNRHGTTGICTLNYCGYNSRISEV